MNYNNNIDELINNEKIFIQKKNFYCSNCNKKGHTFKNCKDSIISNGIIAIYIKNLNPDMIINLENYIVKNLKIFNKKTFKLSNDTSFNYLNKNNDKKINIDKNNINDNIQFLIVQRKHSLGYLEFLRGRYYLENIESYIYLIEQMSQNEINDIITNDFDYLWNNLWDINNIKNKNHHKEYIQSKEKFYEIKLNNIDIIKNIKPLYNFNEWGFPKGRRESYESDLICAIREFEEETSFQESTYTILEKCKSIRENLIGTNGINYAHNYFLSIINDNSDSYDESNREIGQTKVLNILECLNKIRPYHKNKIKIIKQIYIVINNFLEENSKTNLDLE